MVHGIKERKLVTLYVTESEMIGRFSDSLNKAASKAKEFLTATPSEKPRVFVDFIDGIKVAAGSSHQLAHSQENPRWLEVRDYLEGVIELGQNLPTLSTEKTSRLWLQIETSLKNMNDIGSRMATAKAMSRNDVLAHLTLRELNKVNGPKD